MGRTRSRGPSGGEPRLPPSLCDDVVGLVTLFMPRDGQLRRARRDGRKDRRSVVAGGGESPRRAQAHVETAPLAGPRGTDEVTSEHAARGQGHACHGDFCVRGSLPRSAGWPSATAFSALWPHRRDERSAHGPRSASVSPAPPQQDSPPARGRPGRPRSVPPVPALGPRTPESPRHLHGNESGQGQGTHRPQTRPLARRLVCI